MNSIKNKLISYTLVLASVLIILSSSCDRNHKRNDQYPIRVDIRYGFKFFSLRANERGMAYVIKGKGSYFTEPLKFQHSDTSDIFILDSIEPFVKKINRLKKKIWINNRVNTDGARGEIFYNDRKLMDAPEGSKMFLDVYRPLISELPKGFNPFIMDEHPFDN